MTDQAQLPGNSADEGRRKVVKAALAASPVIATLTSKPVQAVQGLSNMLSGNASTCTGDNRYGGMSPGFWKTPGGRTDPPYSDTHADAWAYAGHHYGTLITGTNGNQWEHYENGTRHSDVFGGSDNRPMREVLNEDSGSDKFHLIAGYLNAAYFEAKAGSPDNTLYIMTVQQFWDLYDGTIDVPDAYGSLRDLIESNYHGLPGEECVNVSGNGN